MNKFILESRINRYSFVNSEIHTLRSEFGFIENKDDKIDIMLDVTDRESLCDFSETCMFENAVVSPPPRLDKIGFHSNNNTNIYDQTMNNYDNTLIEYESILTEEKIIHIDHKHMNHFNRAKVDIHSDKK